MDSEPGIKSEKYSEPVSPGELNSWRRGFTPQAEIWNGRMAMFALSIVLMFLVIGNRIIAN